MRKIFPEKLSELLIINAGALFIFIPIFIVHSKNYDVQYHISAAQQLIQNNTIIYPHFLFHGLFSALFIMSKIKPETIAVVIEVAFSLVYINIVFYWLKSLNISNLISIPITFFSILYNPIAVIYPLDHRMYFGYIYANTFHNPTIWTMRPFAFLLFILAIKLGNDKGFKFSTGALSLTIAVLACLAKPNMTLILLPAMILWMIINRMEKTVWQSALWIFLPSLACLTTQYLFSYGRTASGEGISWQPFVVMGMFSQYLPAKLFLSVAFPLAATLLYPDKFFRWPPMQLAWLLFLVGAFLVYSLNETSGLSGGAGNFGWSAQTGLLLLFITSSALLARERPKFNWRLKLCLALLATHIISGSIFYLTELTTRQMQYW